ncbi:MAG: hypothetical protein U0Z53_07850 [Blastocatellia bacterium]
MKINDIKSYTLSDLKANFPARDTASSPIKRLLTQSTKVSINSDIYSSTGVWVNIGGEWGKAAAYTEVKGRPAAPK